VNARRVPPGATASSAGSITEDFPGPTNTKSNAPDPEIGARETSSTSVAPLVLATSRREATRSAPAILMAPRDFASRIASCPVVPSPTARSEREGAYRPRPNALTTVAKGSTNVASSSVTDGGVFCVSRARLLAGIRTNSAIPPGSSEDVRHSRQWTGRPFRQSSHAPHGA